MHPLLKPTLYAVSDLGPVLLGGACTCGHLFFPMQTLGCERCGKNGDALQPKRLRGRGRLISATMVHLHADTRRTAPFAVGTIALDEGPVIRTLLSDVALAKDGIGKIVAAELTSVSLADGTQGLDLRFTREAKDTASAGER